MLLDKFFYPKKKEGKQQDSNMKSILKAISWRIVGTIDTFLIAYFVTGETKIAFSIGSIEILSKMVLYYLHERTWNKITWLYE